MGFQYLFSMMELFFKEFTTMGISAEWVMSFSRMEILTLAHSKTESKTGTELIIGLVIIRYFLENGTEDCPMVLESILGAIAKIDTKACFPMG